MNIVGKYVVSSNGQILGEYKNMITTNGLLAINQYLTNAIPSWAGSIGIGLLSSSATSASTQFLQYEYERFPITLKSYRIVSSSNQIVVKASIDPELVFQAYEIGIFPMTVDMATHIDNYPISDFSETSSGSSAWYIGSVPATSSSANPTPRASSKTVSIAAGQTAFLPGAASISGMALNTGPFNSADYIDVLYYCASAVGSSGSLTVYLGDDTAISPNIWAASGTLSATPSGSFYVSRLNFLAKPDTFSNNVISSSINFAGTGILLLDHMKIVTGDAKTTDHKLVSRTTSASPIITKSYGQPMEIEYYVQVT